MARRGRRRNQDHYTAPDAIAFRSLDESLLGDWTPRTVSPLGDVEDRRRFHPDDYFQSWHETDGRMGGPLQVARPSKILKRAMRYMSSQVQFAAPEKTIVCVRRKARKEVLHALKKTGRGGNKPPKRNWLSDVKC